MPKIIQFGTLEAFVAEALPDDAIIRVAGLDITESRAAQLPDLRIVAVGVHARAINADGHVLACYLPVARMQLYNGRRDSDPAWQRYDEAWAKAEALKKRVIAYLQTAVAGKGIVVRPAGVIDLGDTVPLPTVWETDPEKRREGKEQS